MLWPHGGSGNHGCEAIVRATKAILDGAELELFSSAPGEDLRYGLDECCRVLSPTAPVNRFSARYLAARLARFGGNHEKLDRLALAPLLEAAKKSDLVMSIGGDNYCYGINRHILLVNRLVRALGKKTVLWGCSIEQSAIENREVFDDLAAFDLIVARESITHEALLARGFKNTVLYPDPAFVLESRRMPLPPGFIEGNTVGINVSPMIIDHEVNEGATLGCYEHLVAHIIDSSTMNIALVPHVVWSHNDDRKPLQRLFEKFAHTGRVVVIDDDNATRLKGYIARCRFFVAARTHASIAAYSGGVPTLVVGYSVKARGIARDIFGTERDHVIPVQSLRNGDELIEAFERMRGSEMATRAHYASMMEGYVQRAAGARNEIMRL